MAIQKQIRREELKKNSSEGLGVSLNTVRKEASTAKLSQSERNTQEIAAYAHDIKRSLMVGGAAIAIELALYFFKVIK